MRANALRPWRERKLLSGHKDSVNAVAFSPDGKLVLTGSSDKTARLWEAAGGKPVATLSGLTSVVNAVAFSPDGKLVLTGSADKTARLWETAASCSPRCPGTRTISLPSPSRLTASWC